MNAKKASKRKKSKILTTVHKTAKGLCAVGVMERATMREFDALVSNTR